MALSDLYKDQKRLAQVYDCGPLIGYLDDFVSYLQKQQFSRHTLICHVCAVEGLSLYCKDNRQRCFEDLSKTVDLYLNSGLFTSKRNKKKQTRHGLNRFLHYLVQHHGLKMACPSIPYQNIYEQYQKWQQDVQKLNASTITLRSNYLIKFLHWYDHKSGSQPLNLLNHIDVENFIIEQTSKHGRAFKRSLQSTLRGFLGFCFEKGHCQQDLSGAIPNIRRYRLEQIPKAIEEKQAQQLLGHIDGTTNSGKRDYAIVLLLYTYGVRGAQIRHLMLDDIDWHRGEIFFRALKNAKSARFPLTTEVGNALLDYLHDVRAPSQYKQVFLTLRAPYRPLTRSSSLCQIIRTLMLKHQINSPSRGGHCFRHAFASRLLKQGASFKHIADLLGHRHMSTTFIYTKIDFTSLADVGLTLPEV